MKVELLDRLNSGNFNFMEKVEIKKNNKFRNGLIFTFLGGPGNKDMSLGSNVWGVKNYEEIFEKVYVLFLANKVDKKIIKTGNTVLINVGSGKTIPDLFYAPFIIFRIIRRRKIQVAITYEQVFAFWFLLFKIFTTCKFVLVPITLPHVMYGHTKKALSQRLPIWLEKILRKWSAVSVNSVITSVNLGDYKSWLLNDPVFKKKLFILPKLVEEVPSPFFFKKINEQKSTVKDNSEVFNILCVSRLRKEKLLDDVFRAFAEIVKQESNVILHVFGEGEDSEYFLDLVNTLGINGKVKFYGYKPLLDIVPYYAISDLYLSTFTGNSLREAALYGMPVVAYNMDWVSGTFIDKFNYMAVEPNNYKQLAEKVLQIKNDKHLSSFLTSNIREFAMENWSTKGLRESYNNLDL